ncbi:MAG: WYL domain-containing transcriptional regulator [Deltaproteobacteria bacterium]|nr:WYL domain-containing transcriptional regulator [Deltaproteobacteria bacterium]MBN2673417.1 WYL domain-containing transcriptional regulator [Deltaproteobacteria bacterium]
MKQFTKTERLNSLRMRFSGGGRLSIKRICDDFNVSTKTAKRDLEALSFMGAQLECDNIVDPPVWYESAASRKIEVRYSLHEVMALFTARRCFDFLENTSLEDAIERVYSRIESKLSKTDDIANAQKLVNKVYLIHEGPKRLKGKSSEVLDECLSALLMERKLKIRYRSSNGKLNSWLLCPYSLVVYKRGLYLAAACDEKDEAIRIFALERISSAAWQRSVSYEYPKNWNPEEYFASAFCIVPGTPQKVVLHFTPKTKRYIQLRTYHPTQRLRTLPNGTLQMTLNVPINFELVNWLLSFGPHVEVIKPESLRKEVAGQLQAALSQYGAEIAPMKDMNHREALQDTQTKDLFSDLEGEY